MEQELIINGISFVRTSVDTPDAQVLLNELCESLIGIVGHNGMAHVHFPDFALERAFFLMGYDGDTPVCCAGLRCFDDITGEVKRVYARKNTKGYGDALMHAVEVLALALGYERLILTCRQANQHAIGFYQEKGYQVRDRFPPFTDEEDAVCMQKDIV